MLHVTKGIVLHYFKYSDNSVIIKIFTEHFGIQSYILKGIHSKKNKAQKAYLQPLSIIEIESSQKENKNLQALKSIKIEFPYQSIPFNVYKSAIAFFIAEFLSKTIKEEETNSHLFDFIISSLLILDELKDSFSNFHLVFMAQLTEHFGFQPQLETYKPNYYFNLQEGNFVVFQPNHPFYINQTNATLFYHVFNVDMQQLSSLNFTNSQRKEMLAALIDYYSLHVNNLSNLKSKEVLEEFFL
ncbi:MAG: DNA repair protein RecO [Bacteroidetes bacterium]|nr:DNA repair protein RecO [Bacteroidota bacterium]